MSGTILKLLIFVRSIIFKLQASNSGGMKKQNVTLNVKRVGEAPTFSRNLEDRLITEGEVTIMEAKLNQVRIFQKHCFEYNIDQYRFVGQTKTNDHVAPRR